MKTFTLTIEQAQRLADGIASLPIPYTASRPLMMILEQARITDAPETQGVPVKENADGG